MVSCPHELMKYAESSVPFVNICNHKWNTWMVSYPHELMQCSNPVTLAILHWKIHTFFPRVETIQTEAEGRVLDCFDSREEGMDFPMWNGKGDGNGIPVMCTNRRKSDVWEIFIFLQKYNIEQCNMFAKSITLINVILLEAAFWQEKIQIILQKYYIGQCYTFGKHSHWPM